MFVGHALAAAAAFGAFILLDDARDEDAPPEALMARMAAAGLLAGLTVLFEYQALLVSVALAVYAAVRYRRRLPAVAAFIAGALPPAFALGAYHTALFGRPWRFPYAYIENPGFARTDAPARAFIGLSLPHLVGVSELLVFAVVRAVRVLAGAGAGRRRRSSCCSRAGRAASGATPRWRPRSAVVMFIVPGGHEQLARRLVRRPALHHDGRAVPAVAAAEAVAAPGRAAAVVGDRAGRRAADPVGGAERGFGRALPALPGGVTTTRSSIWRSR